MEIALSSEQESQLSQMAAMEDKAADELAREVFREGLAAKTARHISEFAEARKQSREAVARLLELREGNLLPDGVTIGHLIREGRA